MTSFMKIHQGILKVPVISKWMTDRKLTFYSSPLSQGLGTNTASLSDFLATTGGKDFTSIECGF